MDAIALWPVFVDHMSLIYPQGRRRQRRVERAWWSLLTGENHADLNYGGLTGAATVDDAAALIRYLDDAGEPVVVTVASTLPAELGSLLEEAGFTRGPQPEPIMLSSRLPATAPRGFEVAPVRSAGEVALAMRLAAEGHGVPMIDEVLEPQPYAGRPVTAWLAWQGDEPVSVVWITRDAEWLGVWSMMTPPAHRGRGAGRAVLTGALSASWFEGARGAFLWSSPSGRPLYESLGFAAIDDCAVWARGAGEEVFAAIGNV
jgi:GNAT superfamily N-acetyltransferase